MGIPGSINCESGASQLPKFRTTMSPSLAEASGCCTSASYPAFCSQVNIEMACSLHSAESFPDSCIFSTASMAVLCLMLVDKPTTCSALCREASLPSTLSYSNAEPRFQVHENENLCVEYVLTSQVS
jgi:hypothetical protein